MHLFPISSQKINTFVLHIFETKRLVQPSAILKFGARKCPPGGHHGHRSDDSPSTAGFTFNSWMVFFLSFDLVVFKDLFIFNPLIWGDNPIWLYNFSSGLNQLMLNWPKLVVWVPVVWYSNQGTPFHKKDPFHQEIPNLPNHQTSK